MTLRTDIQLLTAQVQTTFAIAKADTTFVRNECDLLQQVRQIEGRIA
ncbi:MAG: hypothetical protein ACI832_003042 [Rheinheimera aquimaris]|jgi:hypothetical protein|tara:strand:+ start:276 stop:416 length:141 start_codon:yes stop_codon:yes gene_type:complete